MTIYPTCIQIPTDLDVYEYKKHFHSPSRITIVLSFYLRNIYHMKQPRLLSFHWPEPNNQYIFSFLFFFLFFSFFFLFFFFLFLFFFFLEISITRSNPSCFLFIGQSQTTNIFSLFFSIQQTIIIFHQLNLICL